jgi:hypothetical protein
MLKNCQKNRRLKLETKQKLYQNERPISKWKVLANDMCVCYCVMVKPRENTPQEGPI